MRAQNVGIHAMEIYFPKTYVSQEELETYNKTGKGKYTIGLGQKEMAFVKSSEDVNSLALTVVKNLLEKYNVDPKKIGRLEVGTETLLDKSKSTKTVLMQLFKEYGNHDIEGVTSINACYGGTAALFNSLAWVESSSWDGRFSIVVTVDIAVYKKGPARPTGGAGATAMLIGPDAPLCFDNLRSSFIDHQYDFYKPDPRSEFPTVDGHLSIGTYIGAIENCYNNLKRKQALHNHEIINLNNIDYGCFHAPFGKMVQKAYTKLVHVDVLNGDIKTDPQVFAEIQGGNFNSKPVQQHLNKAGKAIWNKKVLPSLEIGSRIGNIYTGSLYAGLASLLSNQSIDLTGKKILMFSYGSGLCSSMFILRVTRNVKHIGQMMNAIERLDNRVKYPIDVYEDLMAQRQQAFGTCNFKPQVNLDEIEEGAYYLTECDQMWRRNYQRKPVTSLKTYNIDTQTQIFSNALKSEDLIQAQARKQIQARKQNEVIIEEKGANRLELVNNQMKTGQEPRERSKSPKSQKQWNGFYKKTLKERLDQMQKIDPEFEANEYMNGGLELQKADVMVENCVGKISIPMGLGLNINMNGQQLQVPMAVEEPSVIAAASSASKFISDKGTGFSTYSSEPIMIGQIQLLDVQSQLQIYKITNNKQNIIDKANESCQNMVKRGGGVKDIRVRFLHDEGRQLKSTGLFTVEQMAVVDLYINVKDSMGANITNTICEHTAPYIQELTGCRVGIKILSNLCVQRKAISTFSIPIKNMAWKHATGEQVAQRIIESYRFAQLDPFRAATHNKGIMNGIDSVALALGQDWRSIESSCHAYASYNNQGQYQPLSHYEIIEEQGEVMFKGTLEVPLSVGTKGGVIDNNKLYENNLRLLGLPNAQKLSEIMVCIGLAQNFAALRALAIEGIQKGHMSLHAKNIAISAGIPAYLAEDAARFMKRRGKISGDIAKDYIKAYKIFGNVRKDQQRAIHKKEILSTFYVELNLPNMEEQLTIHVALDCPVPIHISMEEFVSESEHKQIYNQIFGEKGYNWLQKMFTSLEMVRLDIQQQDGVLSSTKNVVPKLKLYSILIDLITSNMLNYSPGITATVLEAIQNQKSTKEILAQQNDIVIQYGLSLLTELIRILHYNIEKHTQNNMLKAELINEQFTICNSIIKTKGLWSQQPNQENYNQLFMLRKKRLCATMMLLCDCINLKDNEVTPDLINVLRELGGIYEIEITCVHDLKRWNPKQLRDINIYTYWLRSNNKLEFGTQQQQVNNFIEECKELIKTKKIMIKPRLDDRLEKLCNKTSEVIRQFYKFDDVNLSHLSDINNNNQLKPRL